MESKWKCTVCGFLDQGQEPPATCPKCGTDRSQFIPLAREKFNLPRDMWKTLVVHTVASHFPSGLLPIAFLFLVLALLLDLPVLEQMTFYLLLAALTVVPVSLASGLYEWRTRYRGIQASIFYKKIALALSLALFAGTAATLRALRPDLVYQGGPWRVLYFAVLMMALAATALLGHYGGKLIFQWRRRDP